MDNLPYELLSDVLKYLTNKSLLSFYQCMKLMFILRKMNQIQICTIGFDNGERYPFHISKICLSTEKIPNTARTLIIKDTADMIKLPKIIAPLKYIKFNHYYDSDIISIPSTVTHIIFGYNFNCVIDDMLPRSLIYLKFGERFGAKIDNLKLMTPDLQFLQFGNYFNNNVDDLPLTLKYLNFGNYFNNKVNNLPKSITHIKFGHRFEQPIDELPQSIEHIILSDISFAVFLSLITYVQNKNTPLNEVVPPKLAVSIHFNKTFNMKVHNLESLPGVTRLKFGQNFNQSVDKLPATIVFIHFGYYFDQPVDNLPPLLKTIIFGANFDHMIDNLPSLVDRIIFSSQGLFNQSITKLPPSLTYLKLSRGFNRSFDNVITPSLLFIKFGGYFNQPVNNLPSVKRIIFGHDFNQPIDNLPKSVKYLTLGPNFTHTFFNSSLISLTCHCEIQNLQCLRLRKLEIMCYYDFKFEIPKSVRYLKIHMEYVHKIPKTVKYIHVL